MHEQRGFQGRAVGIPQAFQFCDQCFAQGIGVGGLGGDVADQALHLHGLREGAQVESDHGAVDPGAHFGERAFQ